MKAICHAALLAVVAALLVTIVPIRACATETDERIEASAKKSLADESVVSLPGVKSVDNRLELTGARAAENSEDACGCLGLNESASTAVVSSPPARH